MRRTLILVVGLVALAAACTASSTPVNPIAPGKTSSAGACRLPVQVRRFDPSTHAWSGDVSGFLTYPGSGFSPTNAAGARYDTRRGLWLPFGTPTPDGTGYVYRDEADQVHQVIIESGRDRVIASGPWTPLGFIHDSLYLVEVRPLNPPETGVFTLGGVAELNLESGKLTPITQRRGPWWVSSLGLWTVDRADGFQQAPDRVLRVDPATGAEEVWQSDAPNVNLAGFDGGGHPIVVSEAEPVRAFLLPKAGNPKEVYRGARAAGWPVGPSYVDGDRVWFTGMSIKDPTFEAPVWLYRSGSGLRPSIGVPGAAVAVAGACLSS